MVEQGGMAKRELDSSSDSEDDGDWEQVDVPETLEIDMSSQK